MIRRSAKDKAVVKAKKPKSNQRRIIKRLGLELVIIVGACVVLGGAAYFLSNMAGEEKKKGDQSETELLQLSGQAQTLQTQMGQFKDALPLSKKIFNDQGESTQNLSRDLASKVFLGLREVYTLEDVKIDISPIIPSETPEMNKGQVQAITSNISVQMTAYRDKDVLSYAQDVVDQLPGMVTISSISLTRGKEYTLNESGAEEAKRYNEPQVKAVIRFVWYGFQVKEKEGAK